MTSNIGLGLSNPEAALSTAPGTPTGEGNPETTTTTTNTTTTTIMPPHHSTMGQFTLGPAVEQTVTTVTTYKTVQLPPLVMEPPKDLEERDPKQYPLANNPTPANIRNFDFRFNGRPVLFKEAEDISQAARQHNELQGKLLKHKGTIRQEEEHTGYHTPAHSIHMPTYAKDSSAAYASGSTKRKGVAPFAADEAEPANFRRKSKKQRSSLQRTHSEMTEVPSLNDRYAARSFPAQGNPSPVTPDTEVMAAPRAATSKTSLGKTLNARRPHHSRVQELQDLGEQAITVDSDVEEVSQREDGTSGRKQTKRPRAGEHASHGSGQPRSAATATPPQVDSDLDSDDEGSKLFEDQLRRPPVPSIATSSQLDASLPSPSLSPITAAANLASRNALERSLTEHTEENDSVVSNLDLEDDSKTQSSKLFDSQSSSRTSKTAASFDLSHAAAPATQPPSSGLTVMDIPTIFTSFDNMPEGLQTYVMYQLLRRCAKPTLQMVANVVNPALKCDPFNILPPELGLNITRFLDAQSMCRAAQVSKKWRKIINSDEKAWKDLLDRDQFVLPEGEIARAVREGWGWQHPGLHGYEQDLSNPLSSRSDDLMEISEEDFALLSNGYSPKTMRQLKKKSREGVLKFAKPDLQKIKRRPAQASSSVTKPTQFAPNNKWLKLFNAAKGANSFARVATQAVPYPSVGLESLRNMHLFKSLYQRHYLIREAWMDKESEPKHLAFRAHHRHVVTCLLFDSDKILTGSDDTKINVYDTKTGALRTRLEGHEGGVWALQYEGDILVSGSTDRSVRVWNIKTGRLLQTFQGHTSTVRCLVILKPVQVDTEPDGTPIMMPKAPIIITGSRDSTLRVWKLPKQGDPPIHQAGPPANDRENPYFLRTLSGHHNSVRAIAAHGDTLVSGSYDCTVRVWKISTGDLIHRLQGHSQKVYSVVLDHDRGRCISGSMDNLVKVWDLEGGTCLYNLEGHTSLVGLLDLSHDRLVSAAADSTLRIWDPDNGACKATLSAHTGAITCFQHDGQKVISGSDRTLKMWNVQNGNCVRDLLTELSGVWQVRFDERRCVAAVQRNSLTYIEVLDFGASRDGVPRSQLGRRVVVDTKGRETTEVDVVAADQDADADMAD